MDCPHCQISIHESFRGSSISIGPNKNSNWSAHAMLCPACGEEIIQLKARGSGRFPNITSFTAVPRITAGKIAPSDVPPNIAEDYKEARGVLAISAKASAALSRRCLQTILNAHGYTASSLAKQIDSVLAETDTRKALPSALHDTIDSIRNFGNFSAHPIDDKTTNQIIPVEPHEAEFCLDILDEMFDHFYVRPAIAAARKVALNAKLSAAGKPPSK